MNSVLTQCIFLRKMECVKHLNLLCTKHSHRCNWISLLRVVWQTGQTFGSICDSYVDFVKSKYTKKAVVIFDGYPANMAEVFTKFAERERRSRKMISNEVVFNDTMVPTVSKEKFLANDRNKNRLITELMNRFVASNMLCKQAKEDADVLIISTALDMAHNHDNVIIIGEDVDLLVILIGLYNSPTVYFLKPGKGNITQKIYSPMSAVDRTVAKNILFLHAMSGCDTTSALYNQGKVEF